MKQWIWRFIFILLMANQVGCFFNSSLESSLIENTTSPETTEIFANLKVNKLTSAAAFFEASNSVLDCGYYLIGIKGSQRPSTFVYNNKIYLSVPCKTSDLSSGGWHWGLMHWTPTSMSWVDGDTGAAGNDPIIKRSDLDINGFIMNNNGNSYFVDTGSGFLGLSFKFFNHSSYSMTNVPAMFSADAVVTTSGFYSIGFSTANPETMLSTDFFNDEKKGASNLNLKQLDDTWQGSVRSEAELHYKSGTIYIYNTSMNAPTSDTYYISVTTTADMKNFTLPTNYILKGYRYPNVFEFENHIYMIAFSFAKSQWVLIPGTSFTSFDESRAVALNLGSNIYGVGGWDDTPLFTSLPAYEPEIAGVEVLDGKIYIFYMAGQMGHVRTPAHGTSGAPFDSARGIGVFELQFGL